MTRAHHDAELGPTGALLVGDPETVAEKILRVNESLGGISRLTFQMSVAALPHVKMLRAIELLGTRVAPLVRTALASETGGVAFANGFICGCLKHACSEMNGCLNASGVCPDKCGD